MYLSAISVQVLWGGKLVHRSLSSLFSPAPAAYLFIYSFAARVSSQWSGTASLPRSVKYDYTWRTQFPLTPLPDLCISQRPEPVFRGKKTLGQKFQGTEKFLLLLLVLLWAYKHLNPGFDDRVNRRLDATWKCTKKIEAIEDCSSPYVALVLI